MIAVFLANGFEDIEALTPYDLLKRCGADVKLVGVGDKIITSRNNLKVICDLTVDEFQINNLEMVILPGGMPGAANLDKSAIVHKSLDFAYKNNLWIGAICAAPFILGKKGFLDNKKAVCYPSKEFLDTLKNAVSSEKSVEKDQNIITAKGAGAAMEFALCLVEALYGEKQKEKIKRDIIYG